MTATLPTLVLLLSSPRVPAGVLTYAAWAKLAAATAIFGREEDPQVAAVMEAGIDVERLPASGPGTAPSVLAEHLIAYTAKTDGEVIWIGSADGDPGLPEALSARLDDPRAPEVVVEMLVGSWDTPGAKLLDLVAVMDRLRSPGGCPWDAEQTHRSLVPYLIEETYEAVEAIETGDSGHIVEELGDVLLQVVFQARVGADDPERPFTIDEVAAGIVDKLVRRHPHVFADVEADTPAQVAANWEAIKEQERYASAGLPADAAAGHGGHDRLPTLAAAGKLVDRLTRDGQGDRLTALAASDHPAAGLLTAILAAREAGHDADALLRALLRSLRDG